MRLRTLWLKVHLCLGLFAGLLIVVIGLTGSLLVFGDAIDLFLNPALLKTEGEGRARPLDEIVAAARSRHPGWEGPYSLIPPDEAQGVFEAWFVIPESGRRELQVLVHPYTGEILGERIWGESLMSFLFDLHYTLLLGEVGQTVVGGAGIVLMISIGTGLYLWWPARGKFGPALTFKRKAPPARRNFDLHKLSGVYAAPALLIVAFAGVCMTFPEGAKRGVRWLSPVAEWPVVESPPRPGVIPLGVEAATEIARAVFPEGAVKWIGLPQAPDGVYEVELRLPEEVNRSHGRSKVAVDPRTGEVRALRDPRKNTAGETFIDWQFPLHNGEAFGLPGRIVVFVGGFIPLVLYVTGIKLWLRRRLAKRVSRERKGRGSFPPAPENKGGRA